MYCVNIFDTQTERLVVRKVTLSLIYPGAGGWPGSVLSPPDISGPVRRQPTRREWALELGGDNAGKKKVTVIEDSGHRPPA
jgi:hypothetical protein